MFTGIVSGVGEVLDLERLGERDRLTIGSAYDAGVDRGRRLDRQRRRVPDRRRRRAASGRAQRLAFDVGAETLAVTTLGALGQGDEGQSRALA